MNLIKEFNDAVREPDIDWYAKGLVFGDGMVYSLNHDTKMLGRVFEMLTEPILQKIVDENGYELKTPDKQNYYPDFILIPPGKGKNIAVDVKTTYRTYSAGKLASYKFTLGSYVSYLRGDGTKNIEGNYDDYAKHYVIGFLYSRNEDAKKYMKAPVEDMDQLPCAYSDVEYFIQEKYKIAGFGVGSGNTENIGTISSSNIKDFKNGKGPFAKMGKEAFELYWRNYPRNGRKKDAAFTDEAGFYEWVKKNCPDGAIKKKILDYADSTA